MSVYGNSRPQFTDSNGNPIQNGKLYIGEPDKDPVANPNPGVTDLAGAPIGAVLTLGDEGVPTVPFKISGDFSQAVYNSNNVEVTAYQISRTGGFLQESDLVGVSGQGGDWNVFKTYDKDNYVKGPNGKYYKSLTNNNLGNDPVSTSTSWSRLAWPTLYNANENYDIDDSCIAGDGKTYTSLVNGNVGNDPRLDIAQNWTGFNGALAYKSANESIPNSTPTNLSFDMEVYDTVGFHDNVTNNSRLTIPAGVSRVRLKSNVPFTANATGTRTGFFVKNGGAMDGTADIRVNATSSGSTSFTLPSAVVDVVAGDFFEIQVTQSSGGPLDVIGGLPSNAWFSIEVVQ